MLGSWVTSALVLAYLSRCGYHGKMFIFLGLFRAGDRPFLGAVSYDSKNTGRAGVAYDWSYPIFGRAFHCLTG